MIVDTSALVAILAGEPEGPALMEALASAPDAKISAATLVEAHVVVDNRSAPQQRRRLDALLRAAKVTTVPFTEDQAVLARDAYRDFGRGSGHPARLNLGDCYSYALAAHSHEPLLYKGEDFAHTDVRSALSS